MLRGAGIVGSSGVGALHADALRRLGVPIAGIAAATPGIARRDAELLGVERAFDSAAELIAAREVEVVHVCAPNALHLPLCRAALSAGKHVVAEKPLCTSAADAEELLHLAEDAGVVHAVCHGYRYYPMVQALRALVAAGDLGRVHCAHGAWMNEELLTIEAYHWMLDPAQMGPSLSLADVGVHWWDLLEHVTGDSIAEVLCERRAARPGAAPDDGEDSAVLALRLEGGAIAAATICQAAPGHGNTLTLELLGDRAGAAWDIRRPDVLAIRELGGGQRVLKRGTPAVEALGAASRLPVGQPEGHADVFRALLGRVYECIEGGGADHPTFADGLRVLRVLEAAARSAREGGWVPVTSAGERPEAR